MQPNCFDLNRTQQTPGREPDTPDSDFVRIRVRGEFPALRDGCAPGMLHDEPGCDR
jgi:hypothetical protein